MIPRGQPSTWCVRQVHATLAVWAIPGKRRGCCRHRCSHLNRCRCPFPYRVAAWTQRPPPPMSRHVAPSALETAMSSPTARSGLDTARTRVGIGVYLPGPYEERPVHVPLAPSPVIRFLPCPLRRLSIVTRHGLHPSGTRIAPRRHWSPLVHVHRHAFWQGRNPEPFNPPLFSANAESARSLNHVSAACQRCPLATSSSLRRLPYMPMRCSSCRYATRQYSVHAPKGCLRVCGPVRLTTMISPICLGK